MAQWLCDFWEFLTCQGLLEQDTELLAEVSTPEREFVVDKVAKDSFLVPKVETQRSRSTEEGSERSRIQSGSSEGSAGCSFLKDAPDSWEVEDDAPPRDREAEERERRRLEEEEARMERRAAQHAARQEAERRRALLEMLESERVVARFLKQHGFQGVNCPKRTMLGRHCYPLHKASEIGNARLVRMLLREGAIPKMLDSSGRTPLAVAEKRNKNGSHGKVIASLTAPSAAASPHQYWQ